MTAVLLRVMLLVVAMCTAGRALGVQVKDGDRSFPLQAVQTLKGLLDADTPASPRLAWTRVAAVCRDPNLPQVFQDACGDAEVAQTFSRLVGVLSVRDACEICANPSCYGCLS